MIAIKNKAINSERKKALLPSIAEKKNENKIGTIKRIFLKEKSVLIKIQIKDKTHKDIMCNDIPVHDSDSFVRKEK